MTGTLHFPRRVGTSDSVDSSDSGDAHRTAFAMGVFRPAAMVLGCVLLGACNPALNWRETRIKDTALVAMLPCKPDTGARTVPLGGRDVSLNMTGCDAGGATFAVAHATVEAASAAPAVLAQWRKATLANMAAVSSRDVPLNTAARNPLDNQLGSPVGSPLGSAATPPMRVAAEGQRKDGSAVVMQGLWFAKDAQVFHAMVYAERPHPDLTEATEVFFSGLKFQ